MSDPAGMESVDLLWPLDESGTDLLLGLCLSSGVDCFVAQFLYTSQSQRQRMERALFDRLKPHSLGQRSLERTVVYAGRSASEPQECWSLNTRTVELIREACDGSLSSDEPGRYPEDWTFYRDGQLFLGVVSHEDAAFIRCTDDEIARVRPLMR